MFKKFFLYKYAKNCKNRSKFFNIMTQNNVLPPFYGSQCTCNSYNCYHSLHTHNKDAVFPQQLPVYIHAQVSYLRSEELPASGGFAPDPLTRGSAPGFRWGHSPQTPSSASPILAISPKPRASG